MEIEAVLAAEDQGRGVADDAVSGAARRAQYEGDMKKFSSRYKMFGLSDKIIYLTDNPNFRY